MRRTSHAKEKHRLFSSLRAAWSGYVILCSIWVLLGGGYFWLGVSRGIPDGMNIALLCLSVIAVICGWLRGFKITVTDTYFECRGGNYRTTRIPLSEIGRVTFLWVEWDRLGGAVKIPRLAVVTRDRRVTAVINAKPFKLGELQSLVRQLEQLDGYDSRLKVKGKVKVSTFRMFFDLICVAVAVLSIWCIFMGFMCILASCWQ